MDGGLFGGLPPPSAETQEQKAAKLARMQAAIQQQFDAVMAGSNAGKGAAAAEEEEGEGEGEEGHHARKRARLDLDAALVGSTKDLFGDLPPARGGSAAASSCPRGSPRAADGKSPWLGTPWIGGKSPWGPQSTEVEEPDGDTASPGPQDGEIWGSMIGLAAGATASEMPVAATGPSMRRLQLRKSASGFGLNVSASATVLSFNAEPDGSPGPAAAAGVQKGERIVEVNGVSVVDKAGLLAELKKLKAKGVDTLQFGLLPPVNTKPSAASKQLSANAGGTGGADRKAVDAGRADSAEGDAEGAWGEFGEHKDDHFVLGPGVTSLHGGRYKQLTPLGKGTFSRVIGAVDQGPEKTRADDAAAGAAGQVQGSEGMKVAIKCLRRTEHVCATGRHELRTLQLVSQGSSGNGNEQTSTGASLQASLQALQDETHCVHLIDHFITADGHMMLVFPRQDRNLRMVLQASPPPGGIALSQVREYGRQCLLALRYLCKLNLVHNDIKLDNFLLTEKKSRWSKAVRKSTVLLCDFGNASKPQPAVETPYIMARLYRAPELILGVEHGMPVDIWGLACCIFELATRRFLFPGSDSNHTLRAMQETFGPVPTRMVQQGTFAAKHFDPATGLFVDRSGCGGNGEAPSGKELPEEHQERKPSSEVASSGRGKPIRFEAPGSTKLLSKLCSREDRLAMSAAERTEVEQLRDVLAQMLVFEPANRMTAAGALRHPFFGDERANKDNK